MGELREPLEELGDEGLTHAISIMGERWAFLILRAAFNGVKHFEDYAQILGIARNILSNRLGKFVAEGIMRREPCPDDRRKVEYHLTDKGLDLLPAMISLRQWGEKYGLGVPSTPVLVDAKDGKPIGRMEIRAHDGRALSWHELLWSDGETSGEEDRACDRRSMEIE